MDETDFDRERFHTLIELAAGYGRISQEDRFPKGDARDAFLHVACSLVNAYCATLGLEYIAGQRRGETTGDEMVDLVLHGLFGQTSYRTQTLNYFRAKQRAHLFVAVWCAFENALRTIDDSVTPPEDRKAERESGEHVGIPSIWTRLSSVAKKAENNKAVTKVQRRVHYNTVDLWSATRNTIHRNTFYDGPAKTLKLTDRDGFEVGEIQLVPGKPTDFISLVRLPQLIDQLVRAWLYLREGFPDRHAIPMPDLDDDLYEFG
jgi:hypothetical protein